MAQVLRRNGCISVPTDTVFGVCCRMDEAAMEKLYEVKQRPKSKHFPLMVSDRAMLDTIAEVNGTAAALIEAFMPGPLTLILKRKDTLADYVSGGGDTIAVRFAVSQELKALIEEVGTPIFLTSANRSGQRECQSLDEIEQACPLLDGMMEGTVTFAQASTIIDCTTPDCRILREGPITAGQIQQVTGGKPDD